MDAEGALMRRAIEKEETTAPKETEAAPFPGQKARLLTPLEGIASTSPADLIISQSPDGTNPMTKPLGFCI